MTVLNHKNRNSLPHRILGVMCFVFALTSLGIFPTSLTGQEKAQADKKNANESKDKTTPKQKKPPRVKKAWEYWAYEVKTWVVSDFQFETQQVMPEVIRQINQKAYLTDQSSWKVSAERAPDIWNWRLLKYINDVKVVDNINDFG